MLYLITNDPTSRSIKNNYNQNLNTTRDLIVTNRQLIKKITKRPSLSYTLCRWGILWQGFRPLHSSRTWSKHDHRKRAQSRPPVIFKYQLSFFKVLPCLNFNCFGRFFLNLTSCPSLSRLNLFARHICIVNNLCV